MKFLPKDVNCGHIRGKSWEVLPMLRPGFFDVVFIDADHSYQAVVRDLRPSLDLVKEGAILCGDDLNLQLDECDSDFAKAHSEVDFIRDLKTGRNFHLGVTLAVH